MKLKGQQQQRKVPILTTYHSCFAAKPHHTNIFGYRQGTGGTRLYLFPFLVCVLRFNISGLFTPLPLTMPTARYNSTPSVSQNKLENWSGSRAVSCPSVHTKLKSKPNDQELLCFFPSGVTLIYSALLLPFTRGNLLKDEILVLLCLRLNFQGNILIMSVFHCGKECTVLC